MPPLPPVPNVLKLVVSMTIDTLKPVVIGHVTYTGGPATNSDCELVANAFGSSLGTNLRTLYPTTWSLDMVECIDLSNSSAGIGTATIGIDGTDTSASLPGQAAMLLHKQIHRRYRGGHPRTYLPAMATDQKLNDRQWTVVGSAAAAAAWVTAMNELTGSGPWGSINITGEVAVSYRTGNAPRPPTAPFVIDPILAVTGEQVMATQRRRLQRSA